MNSALAEAAEERLAELLPVQHQLSDLLGFPEDRPAVAQLRERRLGGRPQGARNKRLAEVARLVRETLGDVLLQQAAIATMPIADLLALGLKPKEALEEKRLSAGVILPYVEQRQPQRVDVTGRSVVFLDIQTWAGEAEQDQGVIGVRLVELDGAQLDGARNRLIPLGDAAGAQLIADQAAPAPLADPPAPPPPAPPPPAAPPAAPAGPRGGAVSAPRAHSHAPAAVVSPVARVFAPTRNQGSAIPGVGA